MKHNKVTSEQSSPQCGVLHSKIAKIITLSFAVLSLILAGYGVYSLKKNDIYPNDGATENLITATQVFKDLPADKMEFGKHRINHALVYDDTLDTHIHKIDYNYAERYLIQLSIYEEARYARYDGFSCAWVASEEAFMQDIDWLDYLKFRMSFNSVEGKVGTVFKTKDNIGLFSYFNNSFSYFIYIERIKISINRRCLC